jgi:TM2 domain-containing membrane protein YozV
MNEQPMQQTINVTGGPSRKSPVLAAILGLLIVGVGLFYVGKWWAGLGLIIATIIGSVFTGFLLAPVFWIISAVWSYMAAKDYNRRAGYPG